MNVPPPGPASPRLPASPGFPAAPGGDVPAELGRGMAGPGEGMLTDVREVGHVKEAIAAALGG